MEELKEYISVSDYANFVGKTSQQVYNMIHDGLVPNVQFQRGSMVGRLVAKPLGYDEWKATQPQKQKEG